MRSNLDKYTFIFIFWLLLFLPILLSMTGYYPRKSTENRNLSKFPSWQWSIKEYASEYENYFDDHFSLRNVYIYLYALIETKIFNVSPTPVVLVGKDNWLFYWSENDPSRIAWEGNTFDDFRGLYPYSRKELIQICNALEFHEQKLEKMGAYFIFLVGPNQSTIYPEKVPVYFYKRKNKSTRLEQIMDYLNSNNSKINLINPTQALKDGKKKYQTFYSTDAHWNQFGSFLAYQQIIYNVKRRFPDITPIKLEDAKVIESERRGLSTAKLIGLEDIYHDRNVNLKIDYNKMKDYPKLRKAVVFGDSYYTYASLDDYLRIHFKEIKYLHCRWNDLDYRVIEKEKPDVVLYVAVERLAMRVFEKMANNYLKEKRRGS